MAVIESFVYGAVVLPTEKKSADERIAEIRKDPHYMVVKEVLNPTENFSGDVSGIRKFDDGTEYFYPTKGPFQKPEGAVFVNSTKHLIKYMYDKNRVK